MDNVYIFISKLILTITPVLLMPYIIKPNERQIEIYSKQLFSVYLPIYKSIYFQNISSIELLILRFHNNVIFIESIFYENYVLVPESLLFSFEQAKKSNCEDDIIDFLLKIDASYNLLKSSLGYPSNKLLSKYKYFSHDQKRIVHNLFFFYPVTIIIILIAMFDLSSPLFFRVYNTPQNIALFISALFSFLLFYIRTKNNKN